MPKETKPSSSSPMAGIFTRSRAEIFLHRSRSGHARPDPAKRKTRHPYLVPIPPPRTRTAKPEGAIYMSIKDLRAHRVFSPAAVPNECFPDQPSKIEPCIEPMVAKLGFENEEKGDPIEASDEKMSAIDQRIGVDLELLPGSELQGEEEIQVISSHLDFMKPTGAEVKSDVSRSNIESADKGVKASDEDHDVGSATLQPIPLKSRAKDSLRSPVVGIFNRSRAEMLLKCSSYCNARPDPAQQKIHRQYLVPSSPPASMSIDRNFSIISAPKDCFPGKPSKIHPCHEVMIVTNGSENEEKSELIKPYDEPKGAIKESKKEENSKQSIGGDVELLRRSEAQEEEEIFQATPPDLIFLQQLGSNESRAVVCYVEPTDEEMKSAEGNQHAMEDASSPDPDLANRAMNTSAESHHTANVMSSWSQPNPSKNKLGIAPCSRSKLYRNPTSFSYRRLLPYLLDLEKDHSRGTEILHPQVNSVKIEKNGEEIPLLLSADLSPAQNDHDVVSDVKQIVTSCDNPDLTDNHVPENSETNPSHDVDDMIVVETTKDSPTKTPTRNMDIKLSPLQVVLDVIVATESPVLSGENSFQAPEVANDAHLRSADIEFMQSCNSSFHSITKYEALSVEELAGNMLELQSLPEAVEEAGRTLVGSEAEKKPLLVASQIVRSGPLGNRALAPKKGILKKHTRGCKGLCMCLDCASFRLHAERAYEFSRKQMLEADEVVTGLLKELSCLRNIMEKSAASEDDDQLSQKQAKELCQRASRVEALAKTRMGQMIHELNSHCRLPGPRVTFAKSVEERPTP